MTDVEIPDWIKEAQARADEPLHPDLVPYLFTSPGGLVCLKHPWVFDVPFIPQHAYRNNDMLAHKTAAVARAETEADWYSFIWLHERPHRYEALLVVGDNMDDAEWWGLVRDVWIDTENLWQWGDDLRAILDSDRPGRAEMMDGDERHELEAMPDPLTIYRGCRAHNKRGWSWTWDEAVAERMARRTFGSGDPGYVLKAKVAKEHIIAHFLSRGECEIVADPAHVRVFRSRVVDPTMDPMPAPLHTPSQQNAPTA